MFDIGFWEIAVIGVIALLVIGPERLPAVARKAGMWVGRTRRYVAHVKQDIEREINADEMRQLLEKSQGIEDLSEVARETAAVLEDTRQELNTIASNAQLDDEQQTMVHGTQASESSPESNNSDDFDNAEHALNENPLSSSSVDSVSPDPVQPNQSVEDADLPKSNVDPSQR